MNALIICILSVLSAVPAYGSFGRAERTVWEQIKEKQGQENIIYGYNYLAAGEYSSAALEFRSAISKNPENAYARIGYGSALYWLGRTDEAYDEFEKAVKLEPENADAYQLRGIIKSARGQYGSALKDFKYAAKYAPQRGDVRMNMGSVYAVMGDLAMAMQNFRRAVYLDKNSPLFCLQLARCYAALGREEEAEQSYRKAISLYPGYEDAVFELALLLDGKGLKGEALKLYRRAIRIKPGDSVARFRLAVLLYRMGRKNEIAKTVMPGFAIAPPNSKGGISMGISYSSKGQGTGGSEEDSGASGKGEKPQNGKNASRNSSNSSSGAVKESQPSYPRADDILSRVPENHDIKLMFEVLELPKMELNRRMGGEKNAGIGNKMADAMRKPEMNYLKKEFFLPAADTQEREKRIAEIQQETEEMLKKVSPQNEVKVNISMETSVSKENMRQDSSFSGTDAYSDNKKNPESMPRYIPRDVGNDMRLWIYGDNWITNVTEILDDLSELERPSDELRLIRGLGYLLMGETSLAAEDFYGNGIAGALGRSAAYTASGNMEKAVSECENILAADPKNPIAAQNLKWLKYKPEKDKGTARKK